MADIREPKEFQSPSYDHYSEGLNEKDVIEKRLEDPVQREAIARQTGGIVPPTDLVFTQVEEDRVHRKLDWHLLPFVWVLYSLAVLDRSNLGNAKLAGLEEDIDLTGWRYNWLGTIFYIAYICSQWTLMGWKRFPPHIYCTIAVFFWGFIATMQATITSWAGLMACRFFLGVAEAMFGPGVPLYLSFFYPRDKVAFRHGVFISGAAMANAYGGALAYALSHINGSIAPWKILFIIEGIPTCIVAGFAWFFLPDSLAKTKFLNDREKQIAAAAVARNQEADPDRKGGFHVKEVLLAFKEPKAYIPGIMYFSINVSFASLPLFVPTIISEMGSFSKIQSNGLSAPPYLLCVFVIVFVCWLSDHFKLRGPICAAMAMIAAIGFIIQATVKTTGARYFAIFLSVEVFACVSLTLAWVANIHATESKRAGGMTILATIGQFGPLLGTNVFPKSEAPYYTKGMWISASFCLLIVVCSIALSYILIQENKQMEKDGLIPPKNAGPKDGLQDREKHVGQAANPRYRYIW